MKICDLEFDLLRSSNIKGHITIWKPIYDYLYVSSTNYVPKVNDFRVIKRWKSVCLYQHNGKYQRENVNFEIIVYERIEVVTTHTEIIGLTVT